MKTRTGMSLIEILIAMSVFGVSAVGIAKLAMSGSARGSLAAGTTQQVSMMLSEYTRATSVPAAATPVGISCDTIPVLPWNFQRCTRVTNLSTREQRVAVVVQPVGTAAVGTAGQANYQAARSTNAPFRAESLTVIRAANVGALDLSGGTP